jgi:hypothetical protein
MEQLREEMRNDMGEMVGEVLEIVEEQNRTTLDFIAQSKCFLTGDD